MNRYKNDVEKIKASDNIKRQTVIMMQKSLHNKSKSYKKSFQLALSTSAALFVCTIVLSAFLINQRINNQDISLESQPEMMMMESYEESQDMLFDAMIMEEPQIATKMVENYEQESLYNQQDRIVCGLITLIEDDCIEVSSSKVYIDDYTSYSHEIEIGDSVEVLVYYIDEKPYAEWIELAGN